MLDLTRVREESGHRLDLPMPERIGAVRFARLHSARVKFLRVAIIGSCSAGVLIFAFVILFDPFGKLPQNISIGGVGLDGTRVTVDSPKIIGHRKDGLPYDVRATKGYKDILKADITELAAVDARVGMGDGSTSRITAKTGVYDAAKQSVFLQGAVRIKNPTGYDMRMSAATMDFNSGSLVTDQPVDVLLNSSLVTADRMEIRDNGHTISFAGHVKTTTKDDDDEPVQGEALAEAVK